MPFEISEELENRLIQLAADNHTTVETLLTTLIKDFPEQTTSELRLQGIIDSQIDFVCRYLPDTTLTFVNDAYCKYFSRTREELIGKPFLTFADEDARFAILARIEELKVDPTPDVRVVRTINDSGNVLWIQWVDFAITNEQGDIIEIQAVGRDITALKASEAILCEQKELLQTIFDHIPVMIVLIDANGQFKLVNQNWIDLLGWTVDDMQQEADMLSQLYPEPEYRKQALEYMTAAKFGWRDFETVAKDGSLVKAAWANKRLSDGSIIGIGQENSTRRELEQQRLYARQLEVELEKEREIIELRERFIGTVSHEFRTPLSIIMTSIDMVRTYGDSLSPNGLIDRMNKIQTQVEHMVKLLDDVLAISRNNAGKVVFKPLKFDIADFFQQMIDNLGMVDKLSHRFQLTIEATGEITADSQLLEHVFMNLLSNAIKYSPENSTISIEVRHDADDWNIVVQDKGIGIPTEDVPRLFEPFHRAKNATNIAGTGLGLSIVKQYVELHGGSVRVESVVGQGTTFQVYLPRI